MRAAFFGIAAIALGGMASATPAAALPFAGGIEAGSAIEKTQIVVRRVVRGPRCTTVVNRRVGPFGRTVITRTRRCF